MVSSSSSVSRWAGDLVGKCFCAEAQQGLSRGGAGFRPRAPTLRWCRMSPWGPTAPGESWCSSVYLLAGAAWMARRLTQGQACRGALLALFTCPPGTRCPPEPPVSPPPRGCSLILAGGGEGPEYHVISNATRLLRHHRRGSLGNILKNEAVPWGARPSEPGLGSPLARARLSSVQGSIT